MNLKNSINQSEAVAEDFNPEVYLNTLKAYCEKAHPKNREYLSCINPLIEFLKEYKKLVINSRLPFSVKMLFFGLNVLNLENPNEVNFNFQESLNQLRIHVKQKYKDQPNVIKRTENLANAIMLLKKDEVSLETFKEIAKKVRAMTKHILSEDTAEQPKTVDQSEVDNNSKFLHKLLLKACQKGYFETFSSIYEIEVVANNTPESSKAIFVEVLNGDHSAEKSRLQILHLMIENVRDLDGANGEMALEIATANGDLEIVKYLKKCGAKQPAGTTEKKLKTIIDKLVEKGIIASYGASYGELLLFCLSHGDVDGAELVVELIIENAVNIQDIFGDDTPDLNELIPDDKWTYLMKAAQLKSKKLVEFLLKNCADPNLSDDNTGRTPLFQAACQGSLEIVELLLEYGAKVDYEDKLKNTPLFEAAEWGHDKVVELLLKSGADPDRQNILGQTALEFSREMGRSKAIEHLFEDGTETQESYYEFIPILEVLFNPNSQKEEMKEAIKKYWKMTKEGRDDLVDHWKMAQALNGPHVFEKLNSKTVRKLVISAYEKAAKRYPELLELLTDYANTLNSFGDSPIKVKEKRKHYLRSIEISHKILESSKSTQELMNEITVRNREISIKMERLKNCDDSEVIESEPSGKDNKSTNEDVEGVEQTDKAPEDNSLSPFDPVFDPSFESPFESLSPSSPHSPFDPPPHSTFPPPPHSESPPPSALRPIPLPGKTKKGTK